MNKKKTAPKGFLRRLSELGRPADLTQGTPWRVILRYALPIMLSYLLQQIYILADAIICGQVLSPDEVAGVNDTFSLTFIFLQFAFGCTAGFSVITARFVGCRDARGIRRSFASQILLTLAVSLVLTLLSLCLIDPMLGMIHVTPENESVYRAAYSYCFVIFLGIVAQMGYNFICSILRAYGDSVTPLLFLLLSTILNVGLDLLFLIVFHWGPVGAAVATVASQFVSAVGCLLYTLFRYRELRLTREDFRVSGRELIEHLKQGIPLGLQFSILAIGIIVMQGTVVKFDIQSSGIMVPGMPAQNGFGAAGKLVNFLMVFYLGLGSAILGYNAQNLGRGEQERIRKGTRQTLFLMLILYVFCAGVGLLISIRGAYQYIFLSADKISPASIRFGNLYLYADFVLYFILGFLIVVRSAVQGIGRPIYTLFAGIAELFSRIVICSLLPVFVNGGPIDNTASELSFFFLCLGDPGAWFFGSLILLIPFFRYLFPRKNEKKKRLSA